MSYRFMGCSLLLHLGFLGLLWKSPERMPQEFADPLVMELVFEEAKLEPVVAPKTPAVPQKAMPRKIIRTASVEPQAPSKPTPKVPVSSEVYTPPRVQGSQNPLPTYPYVARKRGHEGRVEVTIHLMPSGAIEELVVSQSSGHEELDESVREVLQQWKFIGAKRGENQIKSEIKLGFTFNLENAHVFLG